MKKFFCAVMATMTMLTASSPCLTAAAAEANKNNAQSISQQVAEMSKDYNGEYEEEMKKTGSDSIAIDNRLIVKTDKKVIATDAVGEVYGLGYAFLQFDSSDDAKNAAAKYEKQGLTVQNDTVYRCDSGTGIGNVANNSADLWAYAQTDAESTVEYLTKQSTDTVTVGLIDTGIDTRYNAQPFYDRIVRTNVNFGQPESQKDEADSFGHGTSVASIVAKCTPDNVKIESFRVDCGQGHIYSSSLICAYKYILSMDKNKPDIINMSYSAYDNDAKSNKMESDLLSKLHDSGIVLVASAGNKNTDSKHALPAVNDDVITVAAHDKDGKKCDFSNYGDSVDIAAPGENVTVTKITTPAKYEFYASGTSFAAPFVSAAAAIVLMQNKELTPYETEAKIKSSALNTNAPNSEKWAGAGTLNFYNLIEDADASTIDFDRADGTYTGKFSVSLSDKNDNDTIIYTTDGTLPSKNNGTVYSSPIEITGKTKIIAATFSKDGELHSKYTIGMYNAMTVANSSDFEITASGTVTKYNGSATAIIMPNAVSGVEPNAIGNDCFSKSDITDIILPDTVSELQSGAFSESKLQTIKASGVTKCNSAVFRGCVDMYDEQMPHLSYLGSDAFNGCILMNDFSFSNSIRTALSNAFTNSGIESADFPLLTNERKAFEISPIVSANLPMLEILDGGFNGCNLLMNVSLPNVKEIGNRAFGKCTALPKKMDFFKVKKVAYAGFCDAPFESVELPYCTEVGDQAFYNASAEDIYLPKCKSIGGLAFSGPSLRNLNINSAEKITNSTDVVFYNCINLNRVYAPKLQQIPCYTIDSSGKEYMEKENIKPRLESVYTPRATEFSCRISDYSSCSSLLYIFAPSLENVDESDRILLPESKLFTLYLSSRYKPNSKQTLVDGGTYNVVFPADTYVRETDSSSTENTTFIDSDSMTDALGRSICISVAGIRFGFNWNNLNELEKDADKVEYGFIYSQKGLQNLNIDNVGTNGIKKVVANNKINHGDNTTFNLVVSNIPKAYYDREISARAYVCIDGMYFYSDIIMGSFSDVAELVMRDNSINNDIKSKLYDLLREA